MQRVLRPVVNAIKISRPKTIRGNFSTNAVPESTPSLPPPHMPPQHHHYYYKSEPPRGRYFWTFAAGAFGYYLTSSGSSDSTGTRRMKRATRELEETQDELKRELSRVHAQMDQHRTMGSGHEVAAKENKV
ncbi:Aste57867_15929 [Aphanomyces stellatus]|uniref:Aste57867_15929 protein n=1 Tax=Aphanomyces stellatus TaxID=120398 RepID=A0A485L4A8_9STRA|nr:hypothetical protein As57867_015873 [Aphanomyces stellatus]VFT92715.1 Aste57867_15929 [Aphanomyces stellatus]